MFVERGDRVIANLAYNHVLNLTVKDYVHEIIADFGAAVIQLTTLVCVINKQNVKVHLFTTQQQLLKTNGQYEGSSFINQVGT